MFIHPRGFWAIQLRPVGPLTITLVANAQSVSVSAFDITLQDERGKEMSKDARIWRVYVDEANKADTTMTEGWNRSLDVLLVFVSTLCLPRRQNTYSLDYTLDRFVLRSPEYFYCPDVQPTSTARSCGYN